MPLPLKDPSNPLYNLPINIQCEKLIQWRQWNLTAQTILSLPLEYTDENVTHAFRNLSKHIHPDRNPTLAKEATDAFTVVSNAADYARYLLKTDSDKSIDFETIKNNPFYQAVDEKTPSPPNHDWFNSWFFHESQSPQEKPINNMSFPELIAMTSWGNPISEAIIDRLKQLIVEDNSWLSYVADKENPERTLLSQVAYHGQLEFFKWLIEHGMSPYSTTPRENDAASYAQLNILRYLYQQYGKYFFYDNVIGNKTTPQIWRLEYAIQRGDYPKVQFLLAEIGFGASLDDKTFNAPFITLLKTRDQADNAELINLLLLLIQHGLLHDLSEIFYTAIKTHKITTANHLLDQILSKNIEVLLWFVHNSYQQIEHPNRGSQESVALLKRILKHRTFSVYVLVSQLEKILTSINSVDHCNLAILPDLVSQIIHEYQKEITLINDEEKNNLLRKCYSLVAKYGAHDILKQLLAITTDPLHGGTKNTPLIEALHQKRFSAKTPNDCYDKTISLLIAQGGSQLLQSEVNQQFKENTYDCYTPLHIACKFGLKRQAFEMINKMVEEHYSLDTECQIHKKYPTRHERYTALHLAIAGGHTDIAVNLLNMGANSSIKAVIQCPSSYFMSFFSLIETHEITPLQMAIETRQPKVILAIQQNLLNNYIAERQNQDAMYLSCLVIFGYTLFYFGYSKNEKLEAASALKNALARGETDFYQNNTTFYGALNQGRLGEIAKMINVVEACASSPAQEPPFYMNMD